MLNDKENIQICTHVFKWKDIFNSIFCHTSLNVLTSREEDNSFEAISLAELNRSDKLTSAFTMVTNSLVEH